MELSGLVTAVGIPAEEPHHGGATVGRLRQDHRGVGGDREELHILGEVKVGRRETVTVKDENARIEKNETVYVR